MQRALAGENYFELPGYSTVWSIFWPGEGSVFADAYSNYWAVARDEFFARILGGDRDFIAPSYAVTAPPPLGATAGATDSRRTAIHGESCPRTARA